jgi:hypothetical protein
MIKYFSMKNKFLNFLQSKEQYVVVVRDFIVSNIDDVLTRELREKILLLEPEIKIGRNKLFLNELDGIKIYLSNKDFPANTFGNFIDRLNFHHLDLVKAYGEEITSNLCSSLEAINMLHYVFDVDKRPYVPALSGSKNFVENHAALIGSTTKQESMTTEDISKHIRFHKKSYELGVDKLKVKESGNSNICYASPNKVYQSTNLFLRKDIKIRDIEVNLDSDRLSIFFVLDKLSNEVLSELLFFENPGESVGLAFLRFMTDSLVLIHNKKSTIVLEWNLKNR